MPAIDVALMEDFSAYGDGRYGWIIPNDPCASLAAFPDPEYDRAAVMTMKNVIIFFIRSVKREIQGLEKYIPKETAPRLLRLIMTYVGIEADSGGISFNAPGLASKSSSTKRIY